MAAKRVHNSEVGVRELRANLSRFIDKVKAGSEVVITEHGRPVARLVPSSGSATLDHLIEQGLVTPAKRRKTRAKMPTIKLRYGTIQDLIDEQRR